MKLDDSAKTTWQEVCAIGSAFPLVEPGSYHGYPALRVAGKFLRDGRLR